MSDFKRLCEAAKEAITNREGYCNDRDAEEVVRAVLMALREPSEELESEVGWAFTVSPDYGGCLGARGVRRVLNDVADHILADPAKA